MSAFRITAGDFDVSTGKLIVVSGAEEKAQKIEAALDLARGEWFLDTREGLPLFESILGHKNPDLEIIKRIYRRAILSVEGIVDVQELTLTLNPDRELDYSWVAIADDGQEISGGTGAPYIVQES